MKKGKRYSASAELVDRTKLYETKEGIELALKTANAKFDETMELHVRLGVDGRNADQQVRGVVVLPNGTGKTVKVLLDMPENNPNIWDIYKNGLTCTLNQVDGEWATSLVKDFCPKSESDMAMFVGAIRPAFNSWRDKFINREDYSTGSEQLDEVLQSSKHYILFQENLMQYFEWLGVTPAESIGLIKKISKKKIKPEDFSSLEGRLKENWIIKTGSEDMFDETWEMIQSCMSYGFCSAHGLATGIDSMYGAYLKAYHPLEYYTVALSNYSDDMNRTKRLTDELKYFNITLHGIKFGKSKGDYTLNKTDNSIYKGIGRN